MVKIFGAKWCHDTQEALQVLEACQVPYQYFDIDSSSSARRHVLESLGKQQIPLLDFEDGSSLVVPSPPELRARLGKLALAE